MAVARPRPLGAKAHVMVIQDLLIRRRPAARRTRQRGHPLTHSSLCSFVAGVVFFILLWLGFEASIAPFTALESGKTPWRRSR